MPQSFIVQISQMRRMNLWYYKDMTLVDRLNVHKRNYLRIFINDTGIHLFFQNFAENTVLRRFIVHIFSI